jgi:hypothetical protein
MSVDSRNSTECSGGCGAFALRTISTKPVRSFAPAGTARPGGPCTDDAGAVLTGSVALLDAKRLVMAKAPKAWGDPHTD